MNKSLIRTAVGFLKNPKVANESREKINAFLKKKGLTDIEIKEAYRIYDEQINSNGNNNTLEQPETTVPNPTPQKNDPGSFILLLSHRNLSSLENLSSSQFATQLIASYNTLTSIPKEISLLNLLEILNLSYNKIPNSGLPNEFFALPSLKNLNLSNNQLDSLEKFDELAQLQKLNVSNNLIKEIPESFVNLQDLECLWIYKNKLTSLSPRLILLSKLKQIVIYKQIAFDNPLPSNLLEIVNKGMPYIKEELLLKINS
jgi:Leucine-rich repeat (LRR) protein